MCKKLKMLAVFVAFLSMPALVNAAEIYLTDGNFIQVERCEEKGGEIIFTLKGGDGKLYSVKKELVKEITGKKNTPEETQASR